MRFIKNQGWALLAGSFVLVIWLVMDWLAAKHGFSLGRDRSYGDVFFGATAGAFVVMNSR